MNFEEFVLAAVTDDLAAEPAAREHADAVEFRMDRADDPLEQLAAYDGRLPLICTNRVEWEGGAAAPGETRIEDLALATEHARVEAVDIELDAVVGGSGLDVVDSARHHDVDVVVSVHDFDETPPRQELRRLLTNAAEYGDVAKLAVTAEDLDDALALLAVTRAVSSGGTTVATMAMGETGRHTRAVAPIYGSRLGYAPIETAAATAPGQYDLATLRELVDALATG